MDSSRPVCFIHTDLALVVHKIADCVGATGDDDAVEDKISLATTGNRAAISQMFGP